jgi:hypothetical protein
MRITSFASMHAARSMLYARLLPHRPRFRKVAPNPSIERTNNGGSLLFAFASAQPPLFASHLKRWAALRKHRAMRRSVEPSVARKGLLAWPSTNALVPSFTASEVLVARPRSAQARCRWSAAAGTAPTRVASWGFVSAACRARARSMHRRYPVSWLAAVGARRILRHAECESPCTRTAAKVARLAAPCFIGSIQQVPPNPSIERTNNGGSQLRVFANAQPPLFASHLKR